MKTFLLLLLVPMVLLSACVTEPAPDEPKVYGKITSPGKKAKKAKPVKVETAPVTVVEE